ncbi:LuxR family transcriptional regulator [Streptomyces sp. NPDC001552]|uniref:LuxR family transcriptional regulator n=1 Tax=Streptomyces sp. NPDC001552 TaxID=3364587 RepID=UPI0036AD0D24
MEHALLEVGALIESAMEIHRGRNQQEQQVTAVDGGYGELLDVAEQLIGQAHHSIDIVYARIVNSEELSERANVLQRKLIHKAAGSVSVRLLTTPALLDESFVRNQPGRDRAVAVRVARVPPLQALIVDGAQGLVVAESAVGRQASVLRVPEVLHNLRTLFEGMWSHAAPAGRRIVLGGRDRALLARQILGSLRVGVTDEVAARELTVSVRTYRRYVAEIMQLLGANSRFQAGVRATELGLLPPPGSTGTVRNVRP